ADEDVLEERLLLSRTAGGQDDAATRRDHPQDGDQDLSPEDDQQDPQREAAEQRQRPRVGTARQDVKRHEGRRQQELVGERIHQLAEVGDPAVLARQVAVPDVRQGGDQEQHERERTRPEPRPEDEEEDGGSEQDAQDRQRIRQSAALPQPHG